MAKGKVSAVQPGQMSESELQSVAAGSPVQELQNEVPQPEAVAPVETTGALSLDEMLTQEFGNQQKAEAQPIADEAVQTAMDVGAQARREQIPDLKTRFLDEQRVDTYKPLSPSQTSGESDGGMIARAQQMGNALTTGQLAMSTKQDPRVLAGDETVTPRALPQALAHTGALDVEGNFNPAFGQVASLVTENVLANTLFGDGEVFEKDQGPGAEAVAEEEAVNPNGYIPKTKNNAQLGQEIHREWQRWRNRAEGRDPDDYQEIPKQDAVVLGDAFKEAYAAANPDLVKRVVDPKTKQVLFQLTPQGAEVLKDGTHARKRMFPKQHVRPSKTPLPRGELVGEGRTVTRSVSGSVKEKPIGQQVIKEAMENLNTVANVVDKQRLRILLATMLPALKGDTPLTDVYAEINNFGPSKARKFAAEAKQAARENKEYDAQGNMIRLQEKIAQELYGIATERNGANYLTYYMQAYNGRIAPQQTHFDPTSSKAVRFVTRNAIPAEARPGNRIDYNLQQMYAMMLVKGADMKLPKERVRMLAAATPQLVAWGKRLQEVLDQSMTNEQAEAVADAIAQGIPLTDPNFPQFNALALDSEADADLIKAINGKGEDGPHFIDGLIDYAKYHQAVRKEGRPYRSFFNAYIDGKTNGLAANGIQMGSYEVAAATGVVREQAENLLDDGDIRDQLQQTLLDQLDYNGMNTAGEYKGIEAEMYTIAGAVYSTRALNKATTMTFGYGQEMEAFAGKILETINELEESHPVFADVLARAEENIPREAIAQELLRDYAAALTSVLSDDAIKSRAVMKGAATLHALTNTLFSIRSYTGLKLNFGGMVGDGTVEDYGYSVTKQGEEEMGRTQATVYGDQPSSAAPKMVTNKQTGEVEAHVGRKAVGGAVPGPVQSLDAATVAMTASGKSWKRLKDASQGKPYLHTIYDAFKMDAMGYDVILEEVNNNWLEASMKWSYLKETKHSTRKMMQAFNEEINKIPEDTPIDINLNGEYQMMGHLTALKQSQRGTHYAANLLKSIKSTTDLDEEQAWKAVNMIRKEMKDAGFTFGQTEGVTVKHLKAFVKSYNNIIRLGARLDGMIERTENNKKKLRKKIREQGPVYQYYAH